MISLDKMNIILKKAVKGNFFVKLITNGSGYSSKSFFLVVVTIVGTLLLAMPIFILSIEAWYNHTIATNLSDMAAYIAAVAGVFTSVGLTKVWGEKYEHRLPGPDGKLGTPDDIVVNVSDETWAKMVHELSSKKNDDDEDNSMSFNNNDDNNSEPQSI